MVGRIIGGARTLVDVHRLRPRRAGPRGVRVLPAGLSRGTAGQLAEHLAEQPDVHLVSGRSEKVRAVGSKLNAIALGQTLTRRARPCAEIDRENRRVCILMCMHKQKRVLLQIYLWLQNKFVKSLVWC